jgi:hypothetical protein
MSDGGHSAEGTALADAAPPDVVTPRPGAPL